MKSGWGGEWGASSIWTTPTVFRSCCKASPVASHPRRRTRGRAADGDSLAVAQGDPGGVRAGVGVSGLKGHQTGWKGLGHPMSYRIRLLETEEGWAVSCLDLPGCHSQGNSREEALANIREAIVLWLEVEAEEAGVKSVETLELAV